MRMTRTKTADLSAEATVTTRGEFEILEQYGTEPSNDNSYPKPAVSLRDAPNRSRAAPGAGRGRRLRNFGRVDSLRHVGRIPGPSRDAFSAGLENEGGRFLSASWRELGNDLPGSRMGVRADDRYSLARSRRRAAGYGLAGPGRTFHRLCRDRVFLRTGIYRFAATSLRLDRPRDRCLRIRDFTALLARAFAEPVRRSGEHRRPHSRPRRRRGGRRRSVSLERIWTNHVRMRSMPI